MPNKGGEKDTSWKDPSLGKQRIPHERKIAIGTRTNQIPKTQVMISMPNIQSGRTPKRMPSLEEPSPIIATHHKIQATYSPYNATSIFYL